MTSHFFNKTPCNSIVNALKLTKVSQNLLPIDISEKRFRLKKYFVRKIVKIKQRKHTKNTHINLVIKLTKLTENVNDYCKRIFFL